MTGGSRKVVLITGASAGLGQAVARQVARRGDHLVLTACRGDRLDALAAELRQLGAGGEVLTVAAELEDPATPERLVAATLERFGRLDVLINNAGFGLPTLFADGDPVAIRRQIDVNLLAPLLLTRFALPALVESKGTVINIGSAITALPNPALGAYGATKAGLAYFTNALRIELWHQEVNVCLVEPGPVKTEFFEALTSLTPRAGGYHPMLDAPSPWMSAEVNEVARRITRLIDRPKRRLSVLRRFVWPWRLVGTLFRAVPVLGDRAVAYVLYYHERVAARREAGRPAEVGRAADRR